MSVIGWVARWEDRWVQLEVSLIFLFFFRLCWNKWQSPCRLNWDWMTTHGNVWKGSSTRLTGVKARPSQRHSSRLRCSFLPPRVLVSERIWGVIPVGNLSGLYCVLSNVNLHRTTNITFFSDPDGNFGTTTENPMSCWNLQSFQGLWLVDRRFVVSFNHPAHCRTIVFACRPQKRTSPLLKSCRLRRSTGDEPVIDRHRSGIVTHCLPKPAISRETIIQDWKRHSDIIEHDVLLAPK